MLENDKKWSLEELVGGVVGVDLFATCDSEFAFSPIVYRALRKLDGCSWGFGYTAGVVVQCSVAD